MTPNFGLDPDLAVQEQLLEQKKALADQLTKRGMQSVHVGSGVASPLQGAAQMLNAYYGAQGRKDVAAKTTAIGEDYNRRLSEGVQDYVRARNGTGVAPDPQEIQQSADQGTPMPVGVKGDPQGAMVQALLSRNPIVRQLGTMDYQHMLKKDDPYTLNEGDMRVPGGGAAPVLNPKVPQHAIPADWEKSLPAGAVREPNDPAGVFRMKGTDGQMDVYTVQFDRGVSAGYKKLDSSTVIRDPNASGAVTPVTVQDPKDPTKTIVVDGRTGKLIGQGPKPSTEGTTRAEGFATYNNVTSSLDKLEKQIKLVEDSKLGRTTGLPGILPNVPGFAGADAAGRLDALKSQIGFETLQSLRNAAHNGASGLGQVTEKEHVYLQSQLGNLAKAQSEPEVRRVLKDINGWIAGARQRYKQAYETRFNAGAQPAPQTPPGAAPGAIDSLLEKYK